MEEDVSHALEMSNALEMSVSGTNMREIPTEPFYEDIYIDIVNNKGYGIDGEKMGEILVDVPDSIEFDINRAMEHRDGKLRIIENIPANSSITIRIRLYQSVARQEEVDDELQIQLTKSNRTICRERIRLTT